MKFQLFIKTKIMMIINVVVILLINCKMPTIDRILAFMSRIIFRDQLSMNNCFIASRSGSIYTCT